MRKLGVVLALWCLALISLPAQAGEIVEARCGCKAGPQGRPMDCAWSAQLFLGGGMRNFKTLDWFPAYCAANKSLVRINRKEPGPSLPPCPGPVKPYDDPSLVRRQGRPLPPGQRTSGLILGGKVDYFCPATGRFDLHFHLIGAWD